MLAGGGRDQSFSLFLPYPGQDAPVVPTGDDWFVRWRAMDPAIRGIMRSYTVRGQSRDRSEPAVDFVLHGEASGPSGPAARWAGRARLVREPIVAAVRRASLPGGTPYAWIAGKSAMVRALRRHLVGVRGLGRPRVAFAGYWRRGSSEEDLRAEEFALSCLNRLQRRDNQRMVDLADPAGALRLVGSLANPITRFAPPTSGNTGVSQTGTGG